MQECRKEGRVIYTTGAVQGFGKMCKIDSSLQPVFHVVKGDIKEIEV